MKNIFKIILFVLLINVAAKAHAASKETNPALASDNTVLNNNDSTNGIKSNIIIFKIIATPEPANNNTNGNLKKAGKVARTSYSHTSIELLLTKNKGI